MSGHPDVLILGGGVIGLTTAYFLSRAGARVGVLDKGEFGQESSWAGAGILSPAPPVSRAATPYELLAAHSVRLFPELSAELRARTGVDNGYALNGGWGLYSENAVADVKGLRDAGIEVEEVDERRLREMEPALSLGGRRAYFFPAMGQVRNPRHLKALLAWCGAQGVSLRPGCPALGFETEQGRITGVRTALGVFRADKYLLTAGAWTDPLLADVGWQPGIHPVRGQIVLLNTRTPLLTRVVEEGRRYLVPRADGRVLAGSTEELVGFDKQTTAAAVAGLIEFACAVVPDLRGAAVERCWAGLRPGSPDGMPFLGQVPGFDNLFVAAGHYRAGIHLSPGTGLVMKELILGEPTSIPLEGFRLDRARSG